MQLIICIIKFKINNFYPSKTIFQKMDNMDVEMAGDELESQGRRFRKLYAWANHINGFTKYELTELLFLVRNQVSGATEGRINHNNPLSRVVYKFNPSEFVKFYQQELKYTFAWEGYDKYKDDLFKYETTLQDGDFVSFEIMKSCLDSVYTHFLRFLKVQRKYEDSAQYETYNDDDTDEYRALFQNIVMVEEYLENMMKQLDIEESMYTKGYKDFIKQTRTRVNMDLISAYKGIEKDLWSQLTFLDNTSHRQVSNVFKAAKKFKYEIQTYIDELFMVDCTESIPTKERLRNIHSQYYDKVIFYQSCQSYTRGGSFALNNIDKPDNILDKSHQYGIVLINKILHELNEDHHDLVKHPWHNIVYPKQILNTVKDYNDLIDQNRHIDCYLGKWEKNDVTERNRNGVETMEHPQIIYCIAKRHAALMMFIIKKFGEWENIRLKNTEFILSEHH